VTSRKPSVFFYFDYISSNAYLAWIRLPEILARTGFELKPVPVLFAGLLEEHGQLGPAEVRPKAIWMFKNNLRKAAQLGVPLNPPVHHPFNPLLALRATSLPSAEAGLGALIRGLFDAVWVNGRHISEPAVVEDVANAAGLDGAQLVAEAQTLEAKTRLREQTDCAIDDGVFGVPTMQVNDELFWGYDDLPYLELHLAGEDPLDPEAVAKWLLGRQPSAMRRRFRT
jgi:2-hydroxychromene-2-carboxylate isomerase